jgi:peptidyl-prolyl cis-trans isomerase C
MKGDTIMKKIIASIILMLAITAIAQAVDKTATELNNIYSLYLKQDFQTAEQKLISLSTTNIPAEHFIYSLELGDLYLDKLNNPAKAETIYKSLTENYPKQPNIGDVYYRLGVAYEKQENYLDAAQMYELVATKYRKSQYSQDALDAIERCFKKNYQDLVAKVDGFPITRIEFDDRTAQSPGAYEKFEAKQQLLTDMIGERLMYKEAEQRGLDATPDFKSRFDDIRKNAMFQNWYQKEAVNAVKISEGDKKGYYKKHMSEFITPEQVSAREILVKTKPEIDSLYHLITAYNLKFDSVAEETSLAPTKSSGGDLGYFGRGTQPKEIEDIAFKLKPKQISAPFYSPTKGGYMLIQVDDFKPKKVRTYKEAAPEIENRMRGGKIDATFKTKTDAFRNASSVVVDDSAIKENKDTLALIDGEPITKQMVDEYIAKIPPFYRSDFETPEGKKRIVDQMVLENTWLKQLEKQKYWLLNSVFGQLLDTRKNMLISNLRTIEIGDKAVVSDSDMMREYKKTINDYKVAKQVRSREITVKSESLARSLRIMAMKDTMAFDSLARIYSIAPSKAMGGDMGYFGLGSKPEQIEETAFELAKGKISQPIKINDTTYTLIKVQDIKPATTKPFEDVKSTLSRKMRQDKDAAMYKTYISALQQMHKVETFLVDETPPPQSEPPKTETPKTEEQPKENK